MSKHTKGPWTIGSVTNGAEVLYVIAEDKSDNNLSETAKANARLIAAAPNMLFSLKCLVDLIKHPDAHWRKEAVLNEAINVINKAEGKE